MSGKAPSGVLAREGRTSTMVASIAAVEMAGRSSRAMGRIEPAPAPARSRVEVGSETGTVTDGGDDVGAQAARRSDAATTMRATGGRNLIHTLLTGCACCALRSGATPPDRRPRARRNGAAAGPRYRPFGACQRVRPSRRCAGSGARGVGRDQRRVEPADRRPSDRCQRGPGVSGTAASGGTRTRRATRTASVVAVAARPRPVGFTGSGPAGGRGRRWRRPREAAVHGRCRRWWSRSRW